MKFSLSCRLAFQLPGIPAYRTKPKRLFPARGLVEIKVWRNPMRKLLRTTILAGLMVLFGAAEDGMVFGIGSAQARIGRPLTPMSYAGVARRTTRRAYRRGYYGGYYHY
jgi:hypothetical protein